MKLKALVQSLGAIGATCFFSSFAFAQSGPLPKGVTGVSGQLNPLAISMTDAIWATVFLDPVISEETEGPGAGKADLENLGLDPASAAALFQHVQASVEARTRAATAARDNFCSSREQVVTKEDLVRGVEKIEKASDDARAVAIAKVAEIVSAEAHAKILAVSGERRSFMGKVDFDLRTSLSMQPDAAVARRMDLLCRRAQKPAAMR
ncbi:MAG TPA: hypothetical protein VFO94_21070 [Gammaproteobacteria bacterium]|jgi:hypothetical protein|nr:hypothetical protein [Gammaproteobacteria bacterium]